MDSTTIPPEGISHPDVTIAIIGAGFSGLAMALRLQARGVHDFVILERADDVGGVWRDNDYPGVGVDTPSSIYSLSTNLNPNWSNRYAKGPELHQYTRDIAARHGLLPHIRFGHAVDAARWDDDEALWRLSTPRGEIAVRFLVSAAGLVADPSVPNIPGLADFPGPRFHSSQWNHDLDLSGLRVGVIGTGASAVQFVPAIQKQAAEVHVVQRTAAWVLPKQEKEMTEQEQRRYARFPLLMKLERASVYLASELIADPVPVRWINRTMQQRCLNQLETQIADPELRKKLTPTFQFQCKRPLISNAYYPALAQPNVTVHTGGLSRVDGSTVVSGDGSAADVDVLILNTGFEIGVSSPIARVIHDASGRSLAEHWGDDPHAHKGMAFPGFPNLFIMQGPNATSGVSSSLVYAEAQAIYITDAMRRFARNGVRRAEVRPEAEQAWTAWIRRKSSKTVYERGGCRSYYQNSRGENVVMFPMSSWNYQLRTRRFDAGSFHLTTAAGRRSRQLASHTAS